MGPETLSDKRPIHSLAKTIRPAGTYSEAHGRRVMASLTRFLERKLRLAVNPAKSKVAPLSQCRFLGFAFRRKKSVGSDKSPAQFKRRVKDK